MTGLLLASAMAPARAQEGNSTLGPPQIRDFQLKGERIRPAQPQPVAPAPAPATAPAPAQRAPDDAPPRQPQRTPETARPAEARRPAPEPSAPAIPSQPQDVFRIPEAAPQAPPPPLADAPPAAVPAPADEEGGSPLWLWLAAIALAGFGSWFFLRRPRPASAETPDLDAPPPRPAPVPRPWLELEFKAERAASTDAEASVEFELIIRNTGKSEARSIRVNARMFNAGREQDKEIGAFFKTRGEGRRTHVIGRLPAGEAGLIQGNVTMPREEMRALEVNQQLLFVPVIGVNLVYDWGEGRTGQTSKSYVIGRELGEQKSKMGAFRLDLGPRVYRSVGQRQHSLAKRV